MNIMCPKGCSEYLEQREVDARQEWTEIAYVCPACAAEFSYRVDYEIQSAKVANESLFDAEGRDLWAREGAK
jgi:hypothetical protein